MSKCAAEDSNAPGEALPIPKGWFERGGRSDARGFTRERAAGGGGAGREGAQGEGAGRGMNRMAPAGASGEGPRNEQWTDKYRPRAAGELVGNPGPVQTLDGFLRLWQGRHVDKTVKVEKPRFGAGGQSQGPDWSKKALLLHGSPGLGKTSAARIVAEGLGFTVIEVNASDTRNKSDKAVKGGIGGKQSNSLKELVTSNTINVAGGCIRERGKTMLLMDEVDGMSAGDRGGVGELAQLIRDAKMPVVCICNDSYSQKLKPIKSLVQEVPFRRPSKGMVARRLVDIARREHVALGEAEAERIVETAGGDVRQSVMALQMRCRLRNSGVPSEVSGAQKKDEEVGPFDAASLLMDRRKLPEGRPSLALNAKFDLGFSDMDLVPLLVQENYVNHCPPGFQRDGIEAMTALADASDAISAGDCVNTVIRSTQAWKLAPAYILNSTVIPASLVYGNRSPFMLQAENGGSFAERPFNRFTAVMGKLSSMGRTGRLLGDLVTHMQCSKSNHSLGPNAVRREYMPCLAKLLTKPLEEAQGGAANIAGIIALMDEYCLTKDDRDAILELCSFKGYGVDLLAGVDSKTKAALTRAYNKEDHVVRSSAHAPEVAVRQSKRKRQVVDYAESAGVDEKLLDEGDEEEEEEKEEEPGTIAALFAKKAKGPAGKAAAAGKGKGKATGSPSKPKKPRAPPKKKAATGPIDLT